MVPGSSRRHSCYAEELRSPPCLSAGASKLTWPHPAMAFGTNTPNVLPEAGTLAASLNTQRSSANIDEPVSCLGVQCIPGRRVLYKDQTCLEILERRFPAQVASVGVAS